MEGCVCSELTGFEITDQCALSRRSILFSIYGLRYSMAGIRLDKFSCRRVLTSITLQTDDVIAARVVGDREKNYWLYFYGAAAL